MRRIVALLLVSVSLALHPASTLADTFTIHVFDDEFGTSDHMEFDPVIRVGDTVHWVFDEGFHSTTAAAGQSESWDSGLGPPDQFPNGFDHTFTNAGTFNYYCIQHGQDLGNGMVAGMSGNVTVVPTPGALLTMCLGLAPGVGFVLRRRRIKPGA
jgi:plastocyanin